MTTDTGDQTGQRAGERGDEQGEGGSFTIDELAARAGVTVRTVRFYGTKGLLPPPEIGPRRVGHYGMLHLGRLALIEELQHQGMTLAAIERYLRQLPPGLSARDLAIHRAVVASWAPDTVDTVSRVELEQRAGRALDEADLERLAAMGMLTAEGESFRVDSGLLRLGVRLLDMPLSHESILAARTVLLEHSRAAAHELSRLLRDEVAQRDARDVKSLSADMQPLVVQALLTTFQRSLREELREWLSESQNEGSPGRGQDEHR
ncbi:MerR family transcriptional regulator [Streptomyces sp. YIM S03343]